MTNKTETRECNRTNANQLEATIMEALLRGDDRLKLPPVNTPRLRTSDEIAEQIAEVKNRSSALLSERVYSFASSGDYAAVILESISMGRDYDEGKAVLNPSKSTKDFPYFIVHIPTKSAVHKGRLNNDSYPIEECKVDSIDITGAEGLKDKNCMGLIKIVDGNPSVDEKDCCMIKVNISGTYKRGIIGESKSEKFSYHKSFPFANGAEIISRYGAP